MFSRGARAISHVAIEDESQLFLGFVVERIAHDDPQSPVVLGHGQNGVFASDRFGHQFDHVGRDIDLVEVDVIEAMLLGHGPYHLLTGAVAKADQGVVDFHSGGATRAFRLLKLVAADDFSLNENVAEGLFGHTGLPLLTANQESQRGRVEAPLSLKNTCSDVAVVRAGKFRCDPLTTHMRIDETGTGTARGQLPRGLRRENGANFSLMGGEGTVNKVAFSWDLPGLQREHLVGDLRS